MSTPNSNSPFKKSDSLLSRLAKIREAYGEFIAGMWIENIENESLWRATDPGHHLDIAPTWSWASTSSWVHKADERGNFEVISAVNDCGDDAFKALRFKAVVTALGYSTDIVIQRASREELHYSEYYVRPRRPSSSVSFIPTALLNIHWDTFDPSFHNGGIGFGSALPQDETGAHEYTLLLTSAMQRILMVKQSVDAEYQRIGFVSSHGTASGR